MKNKGKIITPADVNVWPHEMKTAKALAKAGYVVEFIVRREGTRQTSADAKMNDLIWEIKSPKAGKTQAIERNLKRARWQSSNIIFDSQRIKGLPDKIIEKELRKYAKEMKGIKHLLFINRRREIIDIK